MAELVCPVCRRSVHYTALDDVPYRPFCSARCKLVDLGRWLNEEYRVTEEIPDLPDPDDGKGGPAREE